MSIDREGNAWPGAGTTIYRNVTQEPIEGTMRNLKVRELDHFMTLAVYDGGVTAYRLSFRRSVRLMMLLRSVITVSLLLDRSSFFL